MYISNSSISCINLQGVNALPQRKRFKLSIYVNSLKNVSVSEGENELVICFEDGDEDTIYPRIQELYSFLNALIPDIQLSDGLQKILTQIENRKNEKEAYTERLLNARTVDIADNLDFLDFKKQCDQLLRITLRSYQYKAAYLLCLGRGGFDFSVPGAGKTIISYATYAYLKTIGVVDRLFIVGPVSSFNAWYDEYITCFSREPDFENLANTQTSECRMYLSTTERNHREISFINVEKVRLLSKEIGSFLACSNVMLIIDEAHKIKSPNAKSTQAVQSFANRATVRVLLTGTPMPNGYEDLYSLTKVFSPSEDILPYGYGQLKNISKNGASPSDIERIKGSIRPYYSRISKKYLLATGELANPVQQMVSISMEEAQRDLYDRLDSFSKKIDDNIDEDFLCALKKATLIRKMQISANPMLLKKGLMDSMDELILQYAGNEEDSALLAAADQYLMEQFKTSTIAHIVNEYSRGAAFTNKNKAAVELAVSLVSQGKKVLIWDIFVRNMDFLRVALDNQLPGKVELINGSVNAFERQNAIKRFREGDSMILIANPATLAESISLHRACQVAIYVNRNFNCAQYIQSKDRIHRINMPVGTTATYYFFINNDCIDECVHERLQKKEQRMLEILDSDEIAVGGAEYEDINVMSPQDIDAGYRR